jgi:hypothetical protein
MLQRLARPLTMLALVFGGAAMALLLVQNAPRAVSGASALSPNVRHTILNVSCVSAPAFDQNYTKITDVGDFTVVGADSVVELTYHGRVNVDTLVGATGTVFELRVDDLASTLGRGRAHINTVGTQGEHVSFTAVYPDLAPGAHTASVWVRTSTGDSGTGGRVDPGCWSTDVIIVREFAAFGHVFLPLASE